MANQRVGVLSGHVAGGSPAVLDVVVVGAGFSGLCFLKRAKDAGLNVRCFERADGVGGTWHHNIYPGCACDIESKWYSFSGTFSKELEQDWKWSQKFSPQPEILSYLEHVVDRFNLHSSIQLNTTVTTASYDEGRAVWSITTDRGEHVEAQFLVVAEGPISVPSLPDIPGVDTFQGRAVHTLDWPKGEDLKGCAVGVFGTGASGVQAICELAKTVKDLYVFQRTPCWCVPRKNGPWAGTDEEKQFKQDPVKERTKRWVSGSAEHVGFNEEARARLLDGGGTLMLNAFVEFREGKIATVVNDAEMNRGFQGYVRDNLFSIVKDRSTAEKLLPSIPIACKRAIFTDDYWPTFNRPNVHLVDLKDTKYHITPSGPMVDSKLYSLDALVYATGFDTMKTGGGGLRVEGRGGQTLSEKWARGPRTLFGMLCHDFPNMLIVTGPQSPSVMTNVPTAIEMQVNWMIDLIAEMRTKGHSSVEASVEAESQWIEDCLSCTDGTVWSRQNPVLGGCTTWYTTFGKGDDAITVPLAYSGGVRSYQGFLKREKHTLGLTFGTK